jgi:hypothetical protein
MSRRDQGGVFAVRLTGQHMRRRYYHPSPEPAWRVGSGYQPFASILVRHAASSISCPAALICMASAR